MITKLLTWNSLTNWAMTNWCLSVLFGVVRTSGTVLWTGAFFWFPMPSRWLSNPTLPGSWKRWSWGPNGPMLSSGHTVLGPAVTDRTVHLRNQLPDSHPIWLAMSHLSLWVTWWCTARQSWRLRTSCFFQPWEKSKHVGRRSETGSTCFDRTAPATEQHHRAKLKTNNVKYFLK